MADDQLGPWHVANQDSVYEDASFCTLTTTDNNAGSSGPPVNCPPSYLSSHEALPSRHQSRRPPANQVQEDQNRTSTSHIHELAQAEVYKSLTPSLRRLWRPPRASHPREGIDPRYLETQANSWVQRPGVGAVYDWKAQHEQNNAILKQKKAQERQTAVQAAFIKQQENHAASQAAYREWLMLKRQEQVLQRYASKHVSIVSTLPVFVPPREGLAIREAGWEPSTTTEAVRQSLSRSKVINRPGKIAAL